MRIEAISFAQTIRRSAHVVGLAILLIALGASSVYALPDEETPSWKRTFGAQIRQLLDSPDPLIQGKAMQLLVAVAHRDGASIDYRKVRPKLWEVLLNVREDDRLRVLALAALHATGTAEERGYAKNTLAEWVAAGEPSIRVRRHMLLMLAAYQRG